MYQIFSSPTLSPENLHICKTKTKSHPTHPAALLLPTSRLPRLMTRYSCLQDSSLQATKPSDSRFCTSEYYPTNSIYPAPHTQSLLLPRPEALELPGLETPIFGHCRLSSAWLWVSTSEEWWNDEKFHIIRSDGARSAHAFHIHHMFKFLFIIIFFWSKYCTSITWYIHNTYASIFIVKR